MLHRKQLQSRFKNEARMNVAQTLSGENLKTSRFTMGIPRTRKVLRDDYVITFLQYYAYLYIMLHCPHEFLLIGSQRTPVP